MATNISIDDFCSSPSSKEKIGAHLRESRESQNISLQEIRSELKIRPRLIKAIEEADYKNLPDPTSLAALVKSYGIYLGLNGGALADDYRDEIKDLQKNISVDFPQMLPRYFRLSPILLFLSLLIIIGAFLYQLPEYIDRVPLVTNTEISNEVLQKEENINAEVFATENDPKVTENNYVDNNVIIKAVNGTSWIEIKNNANRVIYSGVLNGGEEKVIKAQDGLKMDMGYAAALDISFGGRSIKAFSEKPRVIRRFSLQPEDLKKYYE